jgi:ribosome assembly protein RRB1
MDEEVWNEQSEPLKEGEELVFDNSAYEMLHRAKVEWPCLSIDFLLRDRIGSNVPHHSAWFPNYLHTLDPNNVRQDKHGLMKHKNDRFPYNAHLVAGSQATNRKENKLYVMKLGDMHKTLHDDDDVKNDSESEGEENEKDKEPDMRFQVVPHKGAVNRLRSMYGTGIVATWNDEAEIAIYDVTSAVEALDGDNNSKKKSAGGNKLASFKHKDEGFALDWSPFTYGRLAAGTCNA